MFAAMSGGYGDLLNGIHLSLFLKKMKKKKKVDPGSSPG
jgi:hypothetical protein